MTTTTDTQYPYPTPTSEQAEAAIKLRARARTSRQFAQDSWERSDTDGFVTQYASDLSAREHEANAEIMEHGGYADFVALFDTNGHLVPGARLVQTRYGRAWVYEANGETQWFNPSNAQNE